MKLLELLFLVLYYHIVQGLARRRPNHGCLIRNKYKHELSCHSPRRVFYVFHRSIFDCVQVISNCPRMYPWNEYESLQDCRDDCAYHMQIPTPTPAQGKEAAGGQNKEGAEATAAAGAAEAPAVAGGEEAPPAAGAEGGEAAEAEAPAAK
ncbi:uncharacterized protein [Drosophila kikkawai]|uniref:Uncharacterized protein n=1 Tax=Drosophila kikkawai TaxID=30033 RepID=A0A6P4J4X0_DROKI|nr:uncharacterized protein LOC108079667 [Drosophila kikkawai]